MAFTPADNFRINLLDLAGALQNILDGYGTEDTWATVDEYTDIRGNITISLPLSALPPDPREHSDTVDIAPKPKPGFVCCGRSMEAVISRSTSANAINPAMDTPVWWCPDCHRQIKRETVV